MYKTSDTLYVESVLSAYPLYPNRIVGFPRVISEIDPYFILSGKLADELSGILGSQYSDVSRRSIENIQLTFWLINSLPEELLSRIFCINLVGSSIMGISGRNGRYKKQFKFGSDSQLESLNFVRVGEPSDIDLQVFSESTFGLREALVESKSYLQSSGRDVPPIGVMTFHPLYFFDRLSRDGKLIYPENPLTVVDHRNQLVNLHGPGFMEDAASLTLSSGLIRSPKYFQGLEDNYRMRELAHRIGISGLEGYTLSPDRIRDLFPSLPISGYPVKIEGQHYFQV